MITTVSSNRELGEEIPSQRLIPPESSFLQFAFWPGASFSELSGSYSLFHML